MGPDVEVLIEPTYDQIYRFNDAGIAFAKKNELMGAFNKYGEIIIPFKYDYLELKEENIIAHIDNKQGLISSDGNVLLPIEYDKISEADELGLRMGIIDGKTVYFNEKGKITFEKEFSEGMGAFSANGLALIKYPDGYGYIDSDGNVAIAGEYDLASSFTSTGLALVHLKERQFFIDAENKTVIDVQKIRNQYGQDFLRTPENVKRYSFVGDVAIVQIDNQRNLIDTHGRFVAKDMYDNITLAHKFDVAIIASERKYGLLDFSGAVVATPQFEWLKYSSDGLIEIRENRKYGLLDSSGTQIIAPKYDNPNNFNGHEHAVVRVGKEVGLIDKTGAIVMAPQFDRIVLHPEFALAKLGEQIYPIMYNGTYVGFSQSDVDKALEQKRAAEIRAEKLKKQAEEKARKLASSKALVGQDYTYSYSTGVFGKIIATGTVVDVYTEAYGPDAYDGDYNYVVVEINSVICHGFGCGYGAIPARNRTGDNDFKIGLRAVNIKIPKKCI